jgi:hypothetical protein
MRKEIMNRYIATVALATAAFAGNVFAETPTVVTEQFKSTATRAQVQADLAAYKQAGVNPWSTQYNPLRTFKSAASRADVTGAYVASRDQVAALNGEDSGSAWLTANAQRGTISQTLAGVPQNAQ